MAGIGFELKKLFRERGVLARLRAYGFAGVICAGPMLLGVLLILGLILLCQMTGARRADQELLVAMITYTLLASLLVTGIFSMVVTRYLSDMLFEQRQEAVMPSFWGSSMVMLAVGDLLYGVFLAFSGVPNRLLLFLLLQELILVWNAMSYLTAIEDYKSILRVYVSAVALTFFVGWGLIQIGTAHVEAMLIAVVSGYGWMMTWDIFLLRRSFPEAGDFSQCFRFLRWMDKYGSLALTGLLLNVGVFGHLVILWFSPLGVNISGLFYGAAGYDMPAFGAFLTTLITTVNFVVSVEVRFYPRYRTYYGLYNAGGSVQDIRRAEKDMLTVLDRELKYTALQQLAATVLAIAVLDELLRVLPLGFDDLMLGCFRTLCVGYGLYALGNTMLLLLLYFTDYRGALLVSALFAGSTVGFTLLSLLASPVYLGFGFLLGSAVFFLAAYLRLNAYTGRLTYHILSRQPLAEEEPAGFFTRLERLLSRKGRAVHE